MDPLPADIRLFLARYHGQEDHPDAEDNLRFYGNKLPCQPDGLLVEEIHEQFAAFVLDRNADNLSITDGGETTTSSNTTTVLSSGSFLFANMA